MVKKRGVSIVVDEKFFNTFEKTRQQEQSKIRQKLGGAMFNLSQRNFTALLAARNFRFDIPRRKVIKRRKKR